MAGMLDASADKTGRRTCYSCGNSYPESFRFCPRDSVDLDYLPQPVEDLARDFGRLKRCVAISIALVSVFILVLLAFVALDRPEFAQVAGANGFGVLTVRTTPSGARVYLDGLEVGVSPVRLSDIPSGLHEVRAVFPGYSDGKAHVEILPSATQRLVWDLAPLPSRKIRDRNRYLTELFPKDSAAAVYLNTKDTI